MTVIMVIVVWNPLSEIKGKEKCRYKNSQVWIDEWVKEPRGVRRINRIMCYGHGNNSGWMRLRCFHSSSFTARISMASGIIIDRLRSRLVWDLGVTRTNLKTIFGPARRLLSIKCCRIAQLIFLTMPFRRAAGVCFDFLWSNSLVVYPMYRAIQGYVNWYRMKDWELQGNLSSGCWTMDRLVLG